MTISFILFGLSDVDQTGEASSNMDSLAQQLSEIFMKSSIYKNKQEELKKIDKEIACKCHAINCCTCM